MLKRYLRCKLIVTDRELLQTQADIVGQTCLVD